MDTRPKRSFRRPAVAAGLLLVATTAAGSGEPDATEVTRRLQVWLDGTRDLRGRFTQSLSSGALGTGLEESGTFLLLRPGKMRWDYLEPERKIALIDGDTTRLYVEEDAQLWEGRLEDGALLTALLTGTERLATLFDPALLSTPASGGAFRLQLVPRGPGEEFRHVTLTLGEPDFAIDEAEVLDSAGNLMHYRFFDLSRNTGIPAAAFHFEPPPGTEVVRP